MHCDVQRWPIPGPRHRVKPPVYGRRLSGDLPMRPGKPLSRNITLPNEQRIEIPESVVRWSRGQDFAVENLAIKPYTRVRLQRYVKQLVREPAESIP
jgi:hypothetical protein